MNDFEKASVLLTVIIAVGSIITALIVYNSEKKKSTPPVSFIYFLYKNTPYIHIWLDRYDNHPYTIQSIWVRSGFSNIKITSIDFGSLNIKIDQKKVVTNFMVLPKSKNNNALPPLIIALDKNLDLFKLTIIYNNITWPYKSKHEMIINLKNPQEFI